MTHTTITYRNGRIFDGFSLRDGHALRVRQGVIERLAPDADVRMDGQQVDLAGDIVSPGYVDLQVNGGGGVLVNDDPSLETLDRIQAAHWRLGVRRLLPTLITDTVEKTEAAITAAIAAVQARVPGISGLHLEGPHLSIARHGAHDPSLIRRMTRSDLDMLMKAADALPVLMVTIAPESVTEEQVSALSRAGVLVSLGHTDADFATCRRYFRAGARCATHLFNAMSQLGNREPGLVGAALASGDVSCSLIADAIHVHPESMRIAMAAKTPPGRIFLVTDAMAVAGTDETTFDLGGRPIRRSEGRLTLSDGTLAGADLDLTRAVRILSEQVGVPVEQGLQAATSIPAGLIGAPLAKLSCGKTKSVDLIRISSDLRSVLPLA